MTIPFLKQLGLLEKEAKVYLASLELGEATVLELAKKSALNRTTVYVEIEKLGQRGLVSSIEKGKKRYFSPIHPENLLSLIIEKQKRDLEEKTELFQKILPDLTAIHNLAPNKPGIQFFEGIEGLKLIREMLLADKYKEISQFVNLEAVYKILPEDRLFRKKLEEKFKKEQVFSKLIYTASSPIITAPQEKLDQYKFIPINQISPFYTEINVYGHKTIFGTFKEKITTLIVEDKEIANTAKIMFDLIWDSLTS